jgi:iodotyrosine deiodinase
MKKPKLVPFKNPHSYSDKEMILRSSEYYETMKQRRTIREFSDKPVPREVIENCIATAGTAPNGANMQPWHFVVVSDKDIKKRIREAAEEEEKIFYSQRAPKEWLDALAPLGTDEFKPFLEAAPYLIVIFLKKFEILPGGGQAKNYYTAESVGIATGLLITAVHNAGLVSLTHTPSPMNFLNHILNRPSNEKPFLILVVGHPAKDAKVPEISKKPLKEILEFV